MALTESEKNELKKDILNSIKSESQSVDELAEVTSLDNIKSLPAMRGQEVVLAPVALLRNRRKTLRRWLTLPPRRPIMPRPAPPMRPRPRRTPPVPQTGPLKPPMPLPVRPPPPPRRRRMPPQPWTAAWWVA